jgi:MHS family proline/betaine transporter-like MFS transporter
MTAACVVSILVTIFALPPSVDYREPDWNDTDLPTRA